MFDGVEQGVLYALDAYQFLEVHDAGGEVNLDRDVVDPSAGGACKSVLCFGSPVGTFDLPAVAGVFLADLVVPSFFFPPSRSQECGVSVAEQYGARFATRRKAAGTQGAVFAVAGMGAIVLAVAGRCAALGFEVFSGGAGDAVFVFVVLETACRNAL